MENKQILGALAMDLKRIALSLHRGSTTVASKFVEEAEKRMNEVDRSRLLPYMRETLKKIQSTLSHEDMDKKAEDALMYSAIVQNYIVYK